jgi:sterol desaturase/sphingolipid hydroxylase (fatty acid hydroxylase superfamily)
MDDLQLPNVVLYAIPAFIVLCLLEALIGRWRGRFEHDYRDSAASLAMGLGNVVIGTATGGVILVASLWVHQFRLFDIGYAWWAFLAVLFAEDFVYYWFHRLSHEHRFWWAAHVNHHSSQHYNLTTALRQTWSGFFVGTWLLWLPLSFIGFPPALIIFQQGVSLLYQFWIHTETIGRLGPLEWVLNTPSHHRVHHAINPKYLDRNYAGIFIIWDRLFGTFEAEDPAEPPRYGIVKQLGTFNPVKIAVHEYVDIARDLKRRRGLKAWAMTLFGPPGWAPDGGKTSADIRAEWQARREPPAPAE